MACYLGGVAAKRIAHADAKRELVRLKSRRSYAKNPTVSLAGQRVTVQSLPDVLRPLAQLIHDTRSEIWRRHHGVKST